MGELPLHPALVHLPLGAACVMPLIAAAIAWAVLRERCPARSWLLVVGLQAVVLASAVAAMQAGERDEDRVEAVVGEALLEQHEERATAFTWAAGLTLGVAVLGFLARSWPLRRGLLVGTVVASVVTLVLALVAGHAGGVLVHGPQGLARVPDAGLMQPLSGHDDD